MPTRNKRGVLVPNPDEDILQGVKTLADNLGVITPASSIATARALVQQTPGVSPTTPMYFDIDGVVWKHDGSVFTPTAQVDYAEDYYTVGWNSALRAGQYSGMATTSLPTRPYRRIFYATAQAWGHSPTGGVDLVITTGGDTADKMSLSRFPTGQLATTQTVFLMGEIPAGQKPNISMGIRGVSPSGGRLVLSADARQQRLAVMAFPAPTV